MRWLLLITVVALVAVTASQAHTGSGLIAFSRFRYQNDPIRREIWVARPDGSGLTRLTTAPANTTDSSPSWLGSDRVLVFTRCQEPDGRCTVWRVGTDGKPAEMLSPVCSGTASPTCPDDSAAAASPDGRRIVWARYTGFAQIAVADAAFSHMHVFFPFGRAHGTPDLGGFAWSTDGARIAFLVRNDNGSAFKPVGGSAIFVARVDGSGLHRVTPWSLHAGGETLAWAPSKRILFRSVTQDLGDPGPAAGQIYSVLPDGTGLRQLTHLPYGTPVDVGSWSPDASRVVFTTTRNAVQAVGNPQTWPDVFTMRSDGSDVERVTRTRNWEGSPVWSR